MRIGIDARELCDRPTGVGRYLTNLLVHWAADAGAVAHQFVLYLPDAPATQLDRRFEVRRLPGRPGVLWEQLTMARAAAGDSLDTFFAPGYSLPLALPVPIVVAVHDLSYVAHPEWFRPVEGLRRRWLARRAAARAHTIVTISEFSKRELVARMAVAPERIRVIPPGILPRPDRSAAATPARPAVTSGMAAANVLYVGSVFNRRHVPELILAIGRVARRHPGVSLDIVGENRSHPRQDLAQTIASEALNGRVRCHGYVSESELDSLYHRARAFAFLSDYEGFGFTPLEALARGVPAVLLDTPVARETCGDAALYAPTPDPSDVAPVLERALFDGSARAACLAEAARVLPRYDWRRAARETLDVIVAAGRKPHSTVGGSEPSP